MWSNEYVRRSGISPDAMRSFFRDVFGDCLLWKSDLREQIKPFLKEWKWTGTVDDYLNEWFCYENNVDLDLIREIQKLRKSWIHCHVATNQEKYRLEYLRNEMGFAKDFDTVFCSCELGYKKPQREFYEKILHILGANASEVLYFDDAIENIEAAKELWINAVLYRDIWDLEKILW
jgi:putative hydrolase of the HAD superfamily